MKKIVLSLCLISVSSSIFSMQKQRLHDFNPIHGFTLRETVVLDKVIGNALEVPRQEFLKSPLGTAAQKNTAAYKKLTQNLCQELQQVLEKGVPLQDAMREVKWHSRLDEFSRESTTVS